MKYKHTNRPGFLLGFIDFFTASLFFLCYMPFGGLQNELEEILGHFITGRSWDGNRSVKSVEYGIGIWK